MWEAPVGANATSVGLDVHARSVVACGLDGRTGELFERRLTPDHGDIESWIRSLPGPVTVTYEAGPTGFGLARYLTGHGIECQVAAPSRLQRPSGDRVKTDVRDARHLARLLHLGEIVAVAVPSVEQEAARDLVRARDDVRGDLMSARHRLSKLLLRQGIVYCQGRAWTGVHERWLGTHHFTVPGLQLAFDIAYDTVLATAARRDRLDAAITAMAADSMFTPVVTRLGCLRGVSTLTAFGLAVEIGDWHRLDGRSIGAYLGLVPTESSSGGFRSQGSITKTGNGHARRLLIEAAWHHRKPYRRPGVDLRRRQDRACPAARDRGERGNRRLHQRWASFDARRKRAVVANTAIARELAGWCWSLAVLD
jgi:transposase